MKSSKWLILSTISLVLFACSGETDSTDQTSPEELAERYEGTNACDVQGQSCSKVGIEFEYSYEDTTHTCRCRDGEISGKTWDCMMGCDPVPRDVNESDTQDTANSTDVEEDVSS
jgi:hypothetical protein